MWLRRGALALLCLLGLGACHSGGSDHKTAAPKVATGVRRAAAFRVVYKVEDTVGTTPQVTTDVIQVALPWNGLLEHREGTPPGGTVLVSTIQNQRFTFNTAQTSSGFATRRIPGLLTTAPSPEALQAAADAGLVYRGAEATVAGESCTKWSYQAADKPLAKPTADEGVESCITGDGIPLREAVTLRGRLVRMSEAVQVDRNPAVAPETFLTSRDPGTEGDKGLLESEQQVTEEAQKGDDIVKVTAPEGFTATRQVKVLRQLGPNAAPSSLYVQAFESGTDLVTTEQMLLGSPAWSNDEGAPVDLGGNRSGRIVYRTVGAEVRVTVAGKNVRVTSTRPAVALAVAKALEI